MAHDLTYGGHAFARDLDELLADYGGELSSDGFVEVLRNALVRVCDESGQPLMTDQRKTLESL